MIYNAFLFSDIGSIIEQAIRTFFGKIAATIYTVIAYLYDVFILIAKAEILNSEIVQRVYRSVGLILGIFMIFKLTFSLIQALIDPEKLTDKKNGFSAIIMRCVIAIVLLGITPSLFREAFKLQNLLIGANNSNDNIIYKLIMQNTIGVNSTDMGQKLAADLFFSFYTDEEAPFYDKGTAAYDEKLVERFQRINYTTLRENVTNRAQKSNSSLRWNFYDTIEPLTIRMDGQYVIEFNEIFINLVGIFVLYMLFVYCFQVAARVFKLAFLQLIAPIPILSYISDPEGSFKNWVKQCTSTYLDLFLRLVIIYFVMYLSSDVLTQLNDTNSVLMKSINGDKLSFFTIVLIKIFLIIGLLIFAKKVPELIEEIFPNLKGKAGFGFGLSLKKNVLDPVKDMGKSLYNTPLGWGLKGGKKLGTFIDRKAHHLPKPRGKFGQAMDKWLPGRGEVIKQKRQAQEEERQFNNNMKQGERIYNNFGDDLVEKDAATGEIIGIKQNAFKHSEYANSYLAVERAKSENKKAEQEYQTEYAKYQAAYSRGDQDAIRVAEERIKVAERNKKSAAGKLELMQNKHNSNKKIYADDAKREETYDYYKKTHGEQKEYPKEDRKSEMYHKIAQMEEEKGKQTFTDAERQAEAQRRESQRSSYNNEHESELASQSIFNDDNAMRESDAQYKQSQRNNNNDEFDSSNYY